MVYVSDSRYLDLSGFAPCEREDNKFIYGFTGVLLLCLITSQKSVFGHSKIVRNKWEVEKGNSVGKSKKIQIKESKIGF